MNREENGEVTKPSSGARRKAQFHAWLKSLSRPPILLPVSIPFKEIPHG